MFSVYLTLNVLFRLAHRLVRRLLASPTVSCPLHKQLMSSGHAMQLIGRRVQTRLQYGTLISQVMVRLK
jgi:hypothetical protein